MVYFKKKSLAGSDIASLTGWSLGMPGPCVGVSSGRLGGDWKGAVDI